MSCHTDGTRPDPTCTPGSVDTQNLQVICHTHTTSRRHVSRADRLTIFQEYGIAPADRWKYKIDHLVPLEIGGSNAHSNLWPQLTESARVKDQYESLAHRRICQGTLTPQEAQRAFMSDWTTIK